MSRCNVRATHARSIKVRVDHFVLPCGHIYMKCITFYSLFLHNDVFFFHIKIILFEYLIVICFTTKSKILKIILK